MNREQRRRFDSRSKRVLTNALDEHAKTWIAERISKREADGKTPSEIAIEYFEHIQKKDDPT